MSAHQALAGSRPGIGSWQRLLLDRLHATRPWWAAPAIGAAVAACVVSVVQVVWVPAQIATAHIALDPVAAGAAGAAQEWIATQLALVRSERVAQRVLAEVGPATVAEYSGFDGREAAARLLSRLRVDPADQSGLVSIAYRSDDAALSARIANAFVAAYERVSQELRANAAAAAAERARQRISVLRDEMDQARARLQAVQDANNLRADRPALVEAARVAGLAAEVSWSGLMDDRGAAEQPGLLGNQSVAGTTPQAGVVATEANTGRLQWARDEYELAQQSLAAARMRFGELSNEQLLARPAMALIDAAQAGSGEPSQPHGPLLWVAAIVGFAAGWLVRPLVQWVDPRVRKREDLVSRLGVPVFGALVNAERAAKGAGRRRVSSRPAVVLPAAVPVLQ